MNLLSQRSPVHEILEQLNASWQTVTGQSYAVQLKPASSRIGDVKQLALCDVSGIPSWTFKGSGAAEWLGRYATRLPQELFACELSEVRVTRTGGDEFLVEQIPNGTEPAWIGELNSTPDTFFTFPRQDAIFLLTGEKATQVLSQTCGIDWGSVNNDTMVMTRVAGVSCNILPLPLPEFERYQLRLDASYGIYLWNQLSTICEELDGQVVGVELACPDWFGE